ncbi:RNA recognition motif domain [Trypanosoma melophagium]|uniref:RNA recognition motif domain n=1 Tax=Trypanosoma melophagium TaxID=715481 RepID=UPI00351A32C6|nr:RNA recognition motif domain [Trypanosoma melophagium]
MHKLFVSKIPKSVSTEEVEKFLKDLFPEATHIQLLQGSHSGEHKSHAYAHFNDEAAAVEALQRSSNTTLPTLHGVLIHVKRASRLDVVEANGTSNRDTNATRLTSHSLPPQLAQYKYTLCAFLLSRVVDTLEGVVARCQLEDDVTAVAFETEEYLAAAMAMHPGIVTRCLPPQLPDLLSSLDTRKRRRNHREENDEKEYRDKESLGNNVTDKKDNFLDSSDKLLRFYNKERGLMPLSPAQALLAVRNLMEGRGCIAVRDHEGNIAVLNLPAHVTALE